MDELSHLARLLEYDEWANREVLAGLKSGAPEPAVRTFAHVVATELLWLDRMTTKPQRSAVWPAWSLADCERHLGDVRAGWRDFFRGLGSDALETQVSYVNTKGNHFRNKVGDVITHVWLHSAYHRGQIASALRAAGVEPAYTDFIHAVREGCLAPGGD
jgi:uncharacterized damage-inducible protein DinB